MASPSSGATLMESILSLRGSCMGRVSVTIKRLSALCSRRSSAGPESTPWVQAAETTFAPCPLSSVATSTIVPAVSTSSSMISASWPATSPIRCSTCAWSSLATRRFSHRASGTPSRSAMLRARLALPRSGATTTPRNSRACTASPSSPRAVSSSVGMLKKPWIWPACRSIVRMRLAPAVSSRLAISRAVIGTRGWSFLSERP